MSGWAGRAGRARQIGEQRTWIRPLLIPAAPADAMTAYYALWHDPRRVQLTLSHTPGGDVDGFVAVCQTGRDLFVPLVVVRAPEPAVGPLLRKALKPGRPYTIVVPLALRDVLGDVVRFERQQVNWVYALEPASYRSVINVMVQSGQAEFRHEIRVRDQVVAAAGANWRTDRMAELYVYTASDFQDRGWGKAVGSACVKSLLSSRLLPLYTASEDNLASQRLAESLGFRDSQVREFECLAQLGSL